MFCLKIGGIDNIVRTQVLEKTFTSVPDLARLEPNTSPVRSHVLSFHDSRRSEEHTSELQSR